MRGRAAILLFLVICLVHGASAEIQNCETYEVTSGDKCAKCVAGYGVDFFSEQKKCIQCPTTCTECSQTIHNKLVCTECKAEPKHYTFKVTDSLITCFPCDTNCEDCQNGTGCDQCKEKFFAIQSAKVLDGGQICKDCPQGCEKCTNHKGCETCSQRWYGNTVPLAAGSDLTFTTCNEVQADCEAWENLNGCTKCKESSKYFRIATNKIQASPAFACVKCDNNCEECKDTVGCEKCKSGFKETQKEGVEFKECSISEEPAKSKSSPVVVIVIIVAALLVVAGGIFVAFKYMKAKGGADYHKDADSSLVHEANN